MITDVFDGVRIALARHLQPGWTGSDRLNSGFFRIVPFLKHC